MLAHLIALLALSVAALSGLAQPAQPAPGVAITVHAGWIGWWSTVPALERAVLEASSAQAARLGYRVLDRPVPGSSTSVLRLSVLLEDAGQAGVGDVRLRVLHVRLDAELVSPDGAVRRRSASRPVPCMIRPVHLEYLCAEQVRSAAGSLASQLVQALLGVRPTPPPEEGGIQGS